MAIAFQEWPWYIQVLLYVVLALLIILAGEFIPYSPVQGVRVELDQAKDQEAALQSEVAKLQVVERQHAELQADMEALQKQLNTLRMIVPEEKEVDEFIRMMQGAAASSNVTIRRLTSKAITTREYHYEVPFEMEIDGPYYNIWDFFSRLGRLSRIINVGDLNFSTAKGERAPKYPLRPGTTVTGTFTATTFFTKGVEEPPAKSTGAQAGKP